MSSDLPDVYQHITEGCDCIYSVIYGYLISDRKDNAMHDPHSKCGNGALPARW